MAGADREWWHFTLGLFLTPAGGCCLRGRTVDTLLLDLMLTHQPVQSNTPPPGQEAGRHLRGDVRMPEHAHVNSYARKQSVSTLLRVTATQQCVSTRCDPRWGGNLGLPSPCV